MPEFRGQNLSEFKIRTQRQSTRQFIEAARMQGVPLVLAVNAAPWSPFQSGVAHPYADRMGLAVEQGQLICPSDGKRPSLVITREGAADLVVVEPDADWTQWQVAVSGFAFCLQDGLEVAADTVLHPRTGIGLCPDKRFVVWLVMDGRQAASQGATVQEVGQWLRYFGARDGLNMDGGGSTTLVRWGAEERRGIVMNRPAHGERSNGNNLGIALVEGGQE
jgi:exopolysaccharide biosynthesis protein